MNKTWNKYEILNLYNAVSERKSIRKYKDEPLSKDVIAKVQETLSKLKMIYPEEPVSFRILNASQVKGGIRSQPSALVHYRYKSAYDFFAEKDNPVISRIAPDLWFIDAGIAVCHIWLEASVHDIEPRFIYEKDICEISRKHRYVCTINL